MGDCYYINFKKRRQFAKWTYAYGRFHRFVAAAFAISTRLSGVIVAALALPPFLPSAFAAGSFPSSAGRFPVSSPRDPHHLHGVADDVGGALLAFRTGGHQMDS